MDHQEEMPGEEYHCICPKCISHSHQVPTEPGGPVYRQHDCFYTINTEKEVNQTAGTNLHNMVEVSCIPALPTHEQVYPNST